MSPNENRPITNELAKTNSDTVTQETKDKVFEVRFATKIICLIIFCYRVYHYPMKTDLLIMNLIYYCNLLCLLINN